MKTVSPDNGYFMVVEHGGRNHRISTEYHQWSRRTDKVSYRANIAQAKERIRARVAAEAAAAKAEVES
jgi:hypothetical protein